MKFGGPSPEVEFVSMQDKSDWVLRPVLRGLCRYESVVDGTLSLFDIAVMNESLDVESENQRRIYQ